MRYLKVSFVLTAILFSPLTVSAYHPVTTHAGLTEQIVEFYNYSAQKPISRSDMELMIQASINEDFGTRPLNHFYDPIRKIGINGARSSKVWALDGTVVENDFSWPKAIRAYAEGNDSVAILGLGHILHLIEDLSVPDHTRNDPHKGDGLENGFTGESPYEKWTDETKNRQTLAGLARSYLGSGAKMYTFSDLGEAFDFLANYSNKNFFSRDTIANSIYQYSIPAINNGDGLYIYGIDSLVGDKHRILKIKRNKDTGEVTYLLSDKDDSSILSSYFDRLAKQAVLTGAGVIELFFKEGEKARAEYKLAQEKAQREEIAKNEALANSLASKSYLGLAVAGAGILWNEYITRPVSNVSSKITSTVTLGATGIAQASGHYNAFLFSSGSIATQQAKAVATTEINKAKDTIVSATNQFGTIIRQTLNENVTGKAQAATISETLVVASTIAPSVSVTETKEIESTDAVTVSALETPSTQVVSTPSFTSGGGGRVLPVPAAETLVPEILSSETATSTATILPTILFAVAECEHSFVVNLCAVATTTLTLAWSSSSTPDHFQLTLGGVQNEVATTSENEAQVILSGDGEYSFLIEAYDTATSTTPYASSTQSVLVAQQPIVINEIAWSGTTATSSDQWIELYNTTTHSIDVSKIHIVSPDSDFRVDLSGTVAPHSYFLLERGNDRVIQDISADLVYEAINTSLLSDAVIRLVLVWENTVVDQTPDIACEDFGERGIFCLSWAGGQFGHQLLSMERLSPYATGTEMVSWSSNLKYLSKGMDSSGSPIFGTPKWRNSVNYLPNHGQYADTAVTMTAENSPYIIDLAGHTVYSTESLTIEPGVVMKVYGGSSLYAYGPLYIQGNVSDPVIITSLTDTSIADTIPIRTDELYTTSRVNSITLYDGSQGSVINNLELRSIKDGVVFRDTTATVDGLAISDADYGITVDGGVVLITNMRLNNIKKDAVDVYDAEMSLSNSTIFGVAQGDAIGLYTSSSTIDTISVADVGSGLALGMYYSHATTTASIFRDGTDDGVEIYSSSLYLASSTVEQFQNTAVSAYTSQLSLSGVSVSGSETGVGVYGSVVSMTLSSIFDNTEYGLYHGGLGTVEATRNWWGDMTGPYSETDNPAGLGNGVYGPVNFSDWLLERT